MGFGEAFKEEVDAASSKGEASIQIEREILVLEREVLL
jgi:hypothetical protein